MKISTVASDCQVGQSAAGQLLDCDGCAVGSGFDGCANAVGRPPRPLAEMVDADNLLRQQPIVAD